MKDGCHPDATMDEGIPSQSRAAALRPSRSNHLQVRGLRLHVRSWGREGAPKLFLLHGWMDCSASFQFFADAMLGTGDWHLIAPDWRGYGLSQWSGLDTYWYPELLGDLHHLVDHFQPGEPINLLGHSMGAGLAGLYAGAKPERIARFINVEGYGLFERPVPEAPQRYNHWLSRVDQRPRWAGYAKFEQLAERLRRANRNLTPERALFLARHLGRLTSRGKVQLRCDPRHRDFFSNPTIYLLEEVKACWRAITAPVLWVESDDGTPESRQVRFGAQGIAERKACFARRRDVLFPHTSHQVHIERPEDLASAVTDFLTG